MIQSANNYIGTVWNTDIDGIKISISISNEQHVVVDNSFLLNQIPDINQRVFIDGLVEIDFNDKIEAANQFKVDYNYGIVYVHESKEGQTINVAQYSGRGIIKTYADRIEIRNEDMLYGNKILEMVLKESAERINNLIINADIGIDEVNERLDNLILNQGNSPAEVTDAHIDSVSGATYTLLKDRLNNMSLETNNLKSTSLENMKESSKDFWNPPAQPDMAWGMNGMPSTYIYEDFINNLYEPLRAANSSYIKRIVMGKDQSNTYNVYRYEFTPTNYTKTVIVTAGVHGNEVTSICALYRFCYHLANDYKNYPQLAYIKNNVRFIIIPIVNPWGFQNNKRQNVNTVDLNRNTNYLWSNITGTKYQVGGTYYKGTAPFSEIESQYVKTTLETYSNAVSYVDLHTITTSSGKFIVYYPRYKTNHDEIFQETIYEMFKTGDTVTVGSSAVPTFTCYASDTFEMTACNPEWCNLTRGVAYRDSVEMTESLKWFGNIIIKACNVAIKNSVLSVNSPKAKLMVYDNNGSNPITLTSTIYNNVPHTMYSLKIRRNGLVKASGYAKFTISAPATVSINPILYQSYHVDLSWTDVKDANYNEVKQTLAAGTYVVPINAILHCFPYNDNSVSSTSRPEEVKFRLRAKSTTGTITLESMRVYLEYIPTSEGIAYEVIDATGKEALAEGSDYITTYPDVAKFNYDSVDD